MSELQHACDAMPFLMDKRLVLVDGMLARFDPRRTKSEDAGEIEQEGNPDLAKDLAVYLERVPDTTLLVFLESKSLAKNNSILKKLTAEKKLATVKEFSAPDVKALPAWIVKRVESKHAKIDGNAASELAEHVGEDLRLLDTEIEKLLTYRANEVIRIDDVRALVASVREADVFGLVNAIARRDRQVRVDIAARTNRSRRSPASITAHDHVAISLAVANEGPGGARTDSSASHREDSCEPVSGATRVEHGNQFLFAAT